MPDILHNVNEAGQDSSSDKNEQPSPVSVLDPTFESEDSPSPLEFKEIADDFQGQLPSFNPHNSLSCVDLSVACTMCFISSSNLLVV